MIKNPPVSSRDMGLFSGPGRCHVLLSGEACVPQLLAMCSSPWAVTVEPVHHKY